MSAFDTADPMGIGPTDETRAAVAGDKASSLLDHLGELREQRANETVTDMALPGFEGRLWATYRLPDPAKAMRLSALMMAGNSGLISAAMDLLATATKGLYLAGPGAEAPIHDQDGRLRSGFEHLPGGMDELPINFNDERLERVPQLCPPRGHGRGHTAETRARALFGRDSLVIAAALNVGAWALGSGEERAALESFSETFRNGDQPTA